MFRLLSYDYDLTLEPLPQKVLVSILNGTVVRFTRVVRDCMWEVVGLMLKADLIVFCLMEFNIILGMDWLFQYYAKIDCRKKEVVF